MKWNLISFLLFLLYRWKQGKIISPEKNYTSILTQTRPHLSARWFLAEWQKMNSPLNLPENLKV